MNPGENFFKHSAALLNRSKIPYMIAGTYAFAEYTGIRRPTKDLDIFCKASDYPKIVNFFSQEGFKTEITDDRWLAKIFNKKQYIDIIFGTVGNTWRVDDEWFNYAPTKIIFGLPIKIIAPEEFIWTKLFMQERHKYEGADINHILLKTAYMLDWNRLLLRLELHWEILLAHILYFRFVYPTERNLIPEWVLQELLGRITEQLSLPMPQGKICRGGLLSRFQYLIDYNKWGYTSETEATKIDYKSQHNNLPR